MSDAIFLPFDSETGGIGREVSLLSVHLAACDTNWEVVDDLMLFTKPNDGNYVVTAEALEINKINLIEHDKVAITYSEAGGKLRDFLWRNSKNGKIKLQPMGKNVGFDVEKVTDNILGPKTWSQFVSYRNYDITPLITYLKRTGKLPMDAPESLEGMANYIKFPFVPHTADGDNFAGIAVIKYLESLK
jgi:hypothetical protein